MTIDKKSFYDGNLKKPTMFLGQVYILLYKNDKKPIKYS